MLPPQPAPSADEIKDMVARIYGRPPLAAMNLDLIRGLSYESEEDDHFYSGDDVEEEEEKVHPEIKFKNEASPATKAQPHPPPPAAVHRPATRRRNMTPTRAARPKLWQPRHQQQHPSSSSSSSLSSSAHAAAATPVAAKTRPAPPPAHGKSTRSNGARIGVVVRVRPVMPVDHACIRRQQRQQILAHQRAEAAARRKKALRKRRGGSSALVLQKLEICVKTERARSESSRVDEDHIEEDNPPKKPKKEARDRVTLLRPFYDDKVFAVNRVADASVDQADVYDIVGRPVVADVLEGVNGTILCYGQTGTGKTYTAFGGDAFWDMGNNLRRSNGRRSSRRSGSGDNADVISISSWPCKVVSQIMAYRRTENVPPPPDVAAAWAVAGLLPRTIQHLFNAVEQQQEEAEEEEKRIGGMRRRMDLSVTMMQLYQDKPFDLLAPRGKDASAASSSSSSAPLRGKENAPGKNTRRVSGDKRKQQHRLQHVHEKMPKLCVRQDTEHGVFVDGLTRVPVRGPQHAIALLRRGALRRMTACTSQNDTSSRSHCIIRIHVEQYSLHGGEDAAIGAPVSFPSLSSSTVGDDVTVKVRRSVLTIVDLAGSERVAKSQSVGARLQEACKINRSISALGNCVAALAAASGSRLGPRSMHIPFRDSKLTRLLTSCLSGNSKTVVCASISPCASNYDETFSTLLFAKRAMRVHTRPVVNVMLGCMPLPMLSQSASVSRPLPASMNSAIVRTTCTEHPAASCHLENDDDDNDDDCEGDAAAVITPDAHAHVHAGFDVGNGSNSQGTTRASYTTSRGRTKLEQAEFSRQQEVASLRLNTIEPELAVQSAEAGRDHVESLAAAAEAEKHMLRRELAAALRNSTSACSRSPDCSSSVNDNKTTPADNCCSEVLWERLIRRNADLEMEMARLKATLTAVAATNVTATAAGGCLLKDDDCDGDDDGDHASGLDKSVISICSDAGGSTRFTHEGEHSWALREIALVTKYTTLVQGLHSELAAQEVHASGLRALLAAAQARERELHGRMKAVAAAMNGAGLEEQKMGSGGTGGEGNEKSQRVCHE